MTPGIVARADGGRKPKPTAIKKLQGNAGKRALNKSEPAPAADPPELPDHLDAEAAIEWHKITAILSQMRILSVADKAAIAIYCQAWSTMIEAHKQVREFGAVVKSPNGYPIQNPHLSIANGAAKQLKTMLTELGLTPAARSRVSVPEKEKVNPFAEFLNDD